MPVSRTLRVLAPVALLVGSIAAGVPAHAGAPANDDFANASEIPGLDFARAGIATHDATTEPGEPDAIDPERGCASSGNTVWYRYTPDENVRVLATGFSSDVDAFVGVYTGSTLPGLQRLACSRTAYVRVHAGETYYFQLGAVSIDVDGNIVPAGGVLEFELRFNAPIPPPCAGCPTFENYQDPNGFRAGETNIGVNPKTNTVMFLELTHVMKVTFDDSKSPPSSTWTEVTGPLSRTGTNDPILWTDRATGRTFVSQLVAYCCSKIEFTDDEGATWIPTEPGIALPGWDHQSIGGGPYPAPLNGVNPVYPNQLLYCAQFAEAFCARSDNGGLTWSNAFPATVTAGCTSLHGHVLGGSDGTLYVPDKNCGGVQGLFASSNGGVTWATRKVPGIVAARSDPAAAFDAGGRLYFIGASGDGRALVATSDNGGTAWTQPTDVGAHFGIRNTEFPMAVAGDKGRAAVAFYGTPTDGNDQSDAFIDEWHVYIAITYDGGESWTTIDATPDDPVQRGCIWLGGGSNPCRNLLDFQGMTMDAHGRVIVGYADGCVSEACRGPFGSPFDSRASIGVLARQTTGKGLLEAFDPDVGGTP